jgi:adenylate kinase family enzyme
MKRILVIGSGGAGKSTLARRLADRTGLPLVHLDALFWRAGWRKTSKQEWTRTVEELVQRDAWVMDGNYGGTLDRRLEAADTVIFLDLSRWTCLRRAVKRRIQFHGRSRPDVAKGCSEQLTWEFLRWVWNYPKKHRPKLLTKLAELASDKNVVVLRSPAEVEGFLTSLPSRAAEQGVAGDVRTGIVSEARIVGPHAPEPGRSAACDTLVLMVSEQWIQDLYAEQQRSFARQNPAFAEWARTAGGVLLCATIGSAGFLRPDGSVWVNEVENWGRPEEPREIWREAHPPERWGWLVLGRRHFPAVARLLPPRPLAAMDCETCSGSGSANRNPDGHGRICSECWGLGWYGGDESGSHVV